ncbi:M23 family metallopeptidase [Candidatus Gracilibacteria bacterium]|nr:M23 family metallopeptidase [Candidatus Gracilibacteria bacterium]
MLQKLSIIFGVSVVIGLGILSGYGFVFGSSQEIYTSQNTLKITNEARFVSDLGRTVYLDNEELRSVLLVFRGSDNIKGYKIHSVCNTHSEYKFSYRDIHFFLLEYLDEHCENSTVALKNQDIIISRSLGTLSFSSRNKEFSVLLDMDDAQLSGYDHELARRLRGIGVFRNYNQNITLQTLPNHFKKYQALEIGYMRRLIGDIQEGRQKKYISPVPGYHIEKQANKVPNAGRPYREGYTDGVHHGWDIDAPLGTPIVALDDGIIVRVRDGFKADDFREIVYGSDVSYEQQLENLDILRGNQVWHKTLKGEVIFYSHLDEVNPGLQDGMYIERGSYIGTVGITGVPGTGYEDFHLHFDVKIPPFTPGREGTYTLMEYMKWPWSGKGQSRQDVYSLIDTMFEK